MAIVMNFLDPTEELSILKLNEQLSDLLRCCSSNIFFLLLIWALEDIFNLCKQDYSFLSIYSNDEWYTPSIELAFL